MRAVDPNAFYSDNLEWAKVENDLVTIGITDFAQYASGDIVLATLPDIGTVFAKNDVLCVTESNKAANEVLLPIAGTIIKINTDLKTQPELINRDPYGAGWLVKIKPLDINDIQLLMSPEEYDDYVGALFRKSK